MNALARAAVEDALEAGYQNMTVVADGLDEADLMLPSRCAGWAIGDVLYHQLLDARRALRTFASPSADPPDIDDVGYWRAYSPQSGEHEARGSAEAAEHARHVRIVASAYPPGALAWEWRETAAAACRSARACPHRAVRPLTRHERRGGRASSPQAGRVRRYGELTRPGNIQARDGV